MRKKDVTEKKNMWCFFFLHRHGGSRREMQAKISQSTWDQLKLSATTPHTLFLASLIGHGGAGGVVGSAYDIRVHTKLLRVKW